MNRRLFALFLTLLTPAISFAFSPYFSSGLPVKWDFNFTNYHTNVFNPATKAIRYFISATTYSTNNATAEVNAIRASFDQWQAIPGAALKFEFAGLTSSNIQMDLEDNRNLIFFTKASTLAPKYPTISMTGRAAYTRYRTDAELRVMEADMAINSASFSWYTDINILTTAGYFLEATVTHEIGHFLGLDHTPLGGASVISGGDGIGPGVGLSSDEIAAARFLYPKGAILAQLGTINGFVRANGSPINGAIVTVEGTNGIAISATTSDTSGKYTLPGIPPGTYNVHASPLDSASAGNTSSLLRSAEIPLDVQAHTIFKPSENVSVTVAAGATKSQDFAVTPVEPPFRIQLLSKPSAFQAAPQPARYAIGIYPGQTMFTGVAGAGLTSDCTFTITGDGVTIGPMIFEPNRFYSTLHLLQAQVTVATNATPGLRTIIVRRGSDLAYANGYFEVFPIVRDENFDGLSDAFQRANFPLWTAPEAGPMGDPDNDKFSNAFEAATTTNPNDPNSYSFLIKQITVTQAGATVSWISDPGKSYELYGKTDVAGANWQLVGSVTASGMGAQITDPGATGNKFYRLRLVP